MRVSPWIIETCDSKDVLCLWNSQIFWFGDLNYRLYLENYLARELIKRQHWSALQEFDQLRQELGDGGVFQGWREGNIEFAPTYKYSTFNSNRYSGTLPSRAGEKQRTPAWYEHLLQYLLPILLATTTTPVNITHSKAIGRVWGG